MAKYVLTKEEVNESSIFEHVAVVEAVTPKHSSGNFPISGSVIEGEALESNTSD